MFRIRKSLPVSLDRQGFIYYYSRRYRELPDKEREHIRTVCAETGGIHYKALLAYVTGRLSAPAVCQRYYLSQSTLDRAVRRYYVRMDREL